MGWGVQTFTLAAMMALNKHPRADYLVFADTTYEKQQTYAFIAKWEPWLRECGLNTVTVQAVRPDVIQEDWGDSVQIPAYTVDSQTGKRGQIKRQCTSNWKIRPIRKFIRAEMERKHIAGRAGVVESWQGISYDEWQRMRDSDVQYITNVYPLVERKITRTHCIEWLLAHNLEVPPKSACLFCPYSSLEKWRNLKRNEGTDWDRAVQVDEIIRSKRPKWLLYLHPTRLPLEKAVKLPEDFGEKQLKLAIDLERPCDSGMCFV